jgi:ABC-type amino acid transport system permease subunit
MIIAYWMSGVNNSFLIFLASTSCTLLSTLAGQSLGLLIGTIVFDIEKGIATCTVLSLTLMVAGGFYVRNIPPWLFWVKFISPFKYAYDASVQIVFNTPVPCGAGKFDGVAPFPSCSGEQTTGYLSNEDLLRFLGVQGSVVFNISLLFIMFITFQLAAFLALRSKQATERSY